VSADKPSPLSLRASIATIALCTLVLELTLVRVFDVILTPFMGYAVITAAVFALGLGGIYLYVFPLTRKRALTALPWLFIAFAVSTLLLLPVMNVLPFELNIGHGSRKLQLVYWSLMYLMLIIPFFISGLIITLILSHFSQDVHALYFADLTGAGLGCAILIPLIPPYGPGGIQFLVAAAAIVAALFLLKRPVAKIFLGLVAAGLVVYPAVIDGYLEYRGHANKRNVDVWKAEGKRDYVAWDPVSKLEVFTTNPRALNFALDGGQQGSWLLRFNGDYSAFTQEMREDPDGFFYGVSSLAHYLRRNTNADVLIIGAAVGGESKSAIVFGARHVDAIELVGAMVKAAKTRYAEYSGNAFNHPKINYQVGEGRTFLRGTQKKYDIIQMYSNHTSSSIADGSGAVGANYLQTVEAYEEYFSHLKKDGMLQVNHHLYPRMLTTAARAWQQMGRKEFSRHVMVFERWIPDTLPTMLIKMKPWTQAEIDTARDYLARDVTDLGIPDDARPSPRIYLGHPFEARVISLRPSISSVTIWAGTYNQANLSYDVQVEVRDAQGVSLARQTLAGKDMHDNNPVTISFPPIDNVRGKVLTVRLSTMNPDRKKAFSVWMQPGNDPMVDVRGPPQSFALAFDPVKQDWNLIESALLDEPLPESFAARADYRISPATDDSPFFSMIRKSLAPVSGTTSAYLDGGTKWFLNVQLLRFLSADWLSLFLVAVISLAFSVVFIFLPLVLSRHGRARWPGMASYLVYFSCLGAGFIIVELVFVQVFKKLIGYPTHTYVTVIFSMLLAAGIGSLLARPLRIAESGRWRWVFLLIICLGALFAFTYPVVFGEFLASPLALRIGVAVALLFPVGLLMGMPLPMGIHLLGRLEPMGIPWAWGMNGFFTVFGGFLSVILSYVFGFTLVLLLGFAIYALAFAMFARIRVARTA